MDKIKMYPNISNEVWPRLYGKLGFPKDSRYYGSPSKIFQATKSVTDLLGLMIWESNLRNQVGDEKFHIEQQRTFSRGRNFDSYFQYYAINKTIHPETPNKIRKYIESQIEKNVDFLIYEFPLWSNIHKTRGFTDMITGEWIDGKYELIVNDWKGANKIKPMSAIKYPAQQVGAYTIALSEMLKTGSADAILAKVLPSDLFRMIKTRRDLMPELLTINRGRLVYFTDNIEETQIFEFVRGHENRDFDLDFRESQFLKRVAKFYEIPPEGEKKKRKNPNLEKAKLKLSEYEAERDTPPPIKM